MHLYLEKVNEVHCELLLNWSNEEEVRKNSFNQDKISYDQHIKWFHKKINSNNCLMYILYFNNIPVGQVRLDLEDTRGIISYSIDKNYRGKGLGRKILILLENEVKYSTMINELIGYVKFENVGSQKVFDKLDYNKFFDEGRLKYVKYIR